MASLKGILDKKFAGPGTQLAYEAALGKFLVACNAVETQVRDMLRLTLKAIERDDLWKPLKGADYSPTIMHLQLVSLSISDFPAVPFAELHALNSTRNVLAHGHFDQDLVSEEFKIFGGRTSKETLMTIDEILAWADGAKTVRDDLQSEIVSYFYDNFRDIFE